MGTTGLPFTVIPGAEGAMKLRVTEDFDPYLPYPVCALHCEGIERGGRSCGREERA
jgi:hypothetical protein